MCLERSSVHWVKCTYRVLRSVLSLLQEISWCAKVAHIQHLFQQYDFSFNVYKSAGNTDSKKHTLSMHRDRGMP